LILGQKADFGFGHITYFAASRDDDESVGFQNFIDNGRFIPQAEAEDEAKLCIVHFLRETHDFNDAWSRRFQAASGTRTIAGPLYLARRPRQSQRIRIVPVKGFEHLFAQIPMIRRGASGRMPALPFSTQAFLALPDRAGSAPGFPKIC
jgi:hypothetical protein